MTTTSLFFPPDIEIGQVCRACDIGAGDYYCTCVDEHRCWECNERIAFQYETRLDGHYVHNSCARVRGEEATNE